MMSNNSIPSTNTKSNALSSMVNPNQMNHYLGGSNSTIMKNNNGNPLPSSMNRSSNPSVNKTTQLYMGDLDPMWDESTIKQIWNSLGENNIVVKIITNSNMTSMGRNNPGYCFIEFSNYNNASNALLKNGLVIPGYNSKVLKLNWASMHTRSNGNTNCTANNNTSSNNSTNNDFSVFVGDLAPNVTEAQLFDLFINRYSSTIHAKIVYDQMTNVSKGYGFVRFNNSADQQRSLNEMQGVFLNGRSIRVSNTGHNQNRSNNNTNNSLNDPQHNRSRSNYNNTINNNNSNTNNYSNMTRSESLNFQNRDLNVSSSNTSNSISQFSYPVPQQPALNQFTDPNNTTVFIGGLSSLVSEGELRSYFQPFGTIVYVKIPVGKGCGFVQYVDRSAAETAISKMQGFPIGNSRIRLSWGRFAKQSAQVEHQQYHHQQQYQQQQQQQQHQQQQQQQQQSNSQQHTQPQHLIGQNQSQHQAHEPLLNRALQYQQQQPMIINPTYGYINNSTAITSLQNNVFGGPSVNQTYSMSFANLSKGVNTTSTSDLSQDSSLLLPGYQNLNFSTVPQPTGSNLDDLSRFKYSPPEENQHFQYNLMQSQGQTSMLQQQLQQQAQQQAQQAQQQSLQQSQQQLPQLHQTISNQNTNQNTSNQPQLSVQDNNLFVKNNEAALDRLEKGSNAFIFA
ncbi:hypothetical protein TBLA_0H01790 [Henningerozyma blattae CBS 6284]|uniref:RRM domain-containing protein n=1 Tax=Henningerozyma blattae (strain ATCC 34711 / CBS 6284 / DSM 70876 / NBRC 10599 / NRRL Y-10934 / UCD 77-7) TaxID=1071380 RepID=I2H7W4_HENB6|nr:hypothetical protein TBLA_0H01790 [Tetrapisispora blattae CBS 6284]CCH62466.1 hypothetical protein TBLA_0H01790 [Tetrapisispora blattae CBS 6284]